MGKKSKTDELNFDDDIDFLGDESNEDEEDDFMAEHNWGDEEADPFIKLENEKISTHEVAYANAQTLAKAIEIKKGETVYVNLTGKFIFGDFIAAFIQENDLTVKELTIVSLAGTLEVYGLLVALVEKGWVERLSLVLSEYTIAMDKKHSPKAIEFLKNAVKKHKGKIDIHTGRVHAKLVLIETAFGGKVTMHGSANLRSSQSIEQLIIQENEQLYDFNYRFFQTLKNTTSWHQQQEVENREVHPQ